MRLGAGSLAISALIFTWVSCGDPRGMASIQICLSDRIPDRLCFGDRCSDRASLSRLNCFDRILAPLGRSRLTIEYADGSRYDGEVVVEGGDNYMWVPDSGDDIRVDGGLIIEKPSLSGRR